MKYSYLIVPNVTGEGKDYNHLKYLQQRPEPIKEGFSENIKSKEPAK
jgi:hypothetical protein